MCDCLMFGFCGMDLVKHQIIKFLFDFVEIIIQLLTFLFHRSEALY